MKTKLLPLSILGILIFSQAAAMIFRIDIWPLSCYPMFSRTKTADMTGAFGLKAIDRNGNERLIHLHGAKSTWYTYSSLLEAHENAGLEIRMKRDLDYYLGLHRDVSRDQLVELRLLDLTVGDSNGTETLFNEKVLYKVQL